MNESSSIAKRRKELNIFLSFVEAASLAIDAASVQSVDPPGPDIVCRIVGAAYLSFELVELVDNATVEIISNNIKTNEMLNYSYRALVGPAKRQTQRAICQRSCLCSIWRGCALWRQEASRSSGI